MWNSILTQLQSTLDEAAGIQRSHTPPPLSSSYSAERVVAADPISTAPSKFLGSSEKTGKEDQRLLLPLPVGNSTDVTEVLSQKSSLGSLGNDLGAAGSTETPAQELCGEVGAHGCGLVQSPEKFAEAQTHGAGEVDEGAPPNRVVDDELRSATMQALEESQTEPRNWMIGEVCGNAACGETRDDDQLVSNMARDEDAALAQSWPPSSPLHASAAAAEALPAQPTESGPDLHPLVSEVQDGWSGGVLDARNMETLGCDSAMAPARKHVNDSAPHSLKDDVQAQRERQMLRLQKQLAEDHEEAELLRERNAQLEAALTELEGQVVQLRERLQAAHVSRDQMQRLESLEKEGIELSLRLGLEREKVKALAEEKRGLGARVKQLEDELSQSVAREAELRSGSKLREQSQSDSQRVIERLQRSVSELEEGQKALAAQLLQSKQAEEAAATALQMAKELHQAQIAEQRENYSKTIKLLESEIEKQYATQRRSVVDSDQRISELERELTAANRRAHVAQTQLADHEQSSLGSLQEMRRELVEAEDRSSKLNKRVHVLESEMRELQGEHRRALDAVTAERQEARRELAVLEVECNSLRAAKQQASVDLMREKQNASVMRHQLADATKKLSMYEERIADAPSLGVRRHSGSALSSLTVTPGPQAAAEASECELSPPSHAARSLVGQSTVRGGSVSDRDDTSHADRVAHASGALLPPGLVARRESSKARERMERELLRQAVEIERLRRVEAQALQQEQQLRALEVQHDLLLQMYGQQEELLKGKSGAAQP